MKLLAKYCYEGSIEDMKNMLDGKLPHCFNNRKPEYTEGLEENYRAAVKLWKEMKIRNLNWKEIQKYLDSESDCQNGTDYAN